MERPTSTLGLLLHILRTRWQGLTARGRMGASLAIALFAVAGIFGARMALGGACCASACPARQAQLAAEAAELEAATVAGADTAEADTDCASAH